jgi:hypothetical protein
MIDPWRNFIHLKCVRRLGSKTSDITEPVKTELSPRQRKIIFLGVPQVGLSSSWACQRRMIIFLGAPTKDNCYLVFVELLVPSVLGLTCLPDSRYLEFGRWPSSSTLGLACSLDPHYLILLGVPCDSHSFGRAKRGCSYFFRRAKSGWSFPWAC